MTPEALTAATIEAAKQIKTRLKLIGIPTPEWFQGETAELIQREIDKITGYYPLFIEANPSRKTLKSMQDKWIADRKIANNQ